MTNAGFWIISDCVSVESGPLRCSPWRGTFIYSGLLLSCAIGFIYIDINLFQVCEHNYRVNAI